MSATATETVTFDRDEILEITVELQAAIAYMHDLMGIDTGGDAESKPKASLGEIRRRLLTVAGVLDADGEPTDELLEDRLFNAGTDRGWDWFEGDHALICGAFGRWMARALEARSA